MPKYLPGRGTGAEMSPVIALKPDPLGLPRNPLAVYLLCLALLSGTLMLAGVSTAKSIEDTLPHYVALTWASILVFGSSVTLIGMYWLGEVATGLLMKRVGMFSLTVAAFVYTAVLLFAFGTAGIFTAGVVGGFGAACLLQFNRINARVKQIIEASS